MPTTTRRAAAAIADRSSSERNSLPPEPVAGRSNKKTKGTTTTVPKSTTKSKEVYTRSQLSTPVEPPIGPSTHAPSGAEVDEPTGRVSPKAKSPIHQRPLTLQSTPQPLPDGVPQTFLPVPAENNSANHSANQSDNDEVDLEGQCRESGLRDSPSSNSDYSDTRKKLTQKRQQHALAQRRHDVTNTEEEDGNDDDDNDDKVDQVDPVLPNTLQTTEASSCNDQGKQKYPLKALKRGPLSAEAKEDIRAFSTQVLEMAQDLADRLRMSRKNVLISAGLGIRESRGENVRHFNVANLHSQWYATRHTKPTEVSREDYARQISADYHGLVDGKSAEEKASNLKDVREWAASRDRILNDELSLTSVTTQVKSIRDKFTGLSQSVENLYDISVIGALVYKGSDTAGQQLSTLFTGSPVLRQLIDNNDINVREVLDRLRTAIKAPELVAEGFNLPTFNYEPPHEFHQRPGESAKDRDRRVAGVIFRDALVPFLPVYSTSLKMHLPWKRWVEVAGKEGLCIIDWVDGAIPPGPDFDLKKLGAPELREISGSYVDGILNGNDDSEVFSVIQWSAEQHALPDTDPEKGLIPLVVTRLGTHVRQLKDSYTWQKHIATQHKMATHIEHGQPEESRDLGIENEGDGDSEDTFEDERRYNGNWSDNRNGVQYNPTSMPGRSSRRHPTQPRLQPKSRSGTISRQQSVQPQLQRDTLADLIHPHLPGPPPRSTIRTNVPRQQSTQRGGTSVDLNRKSHEASSFLPNNPRQFAVRSTAHRPSHNFRSRPPPSDPTQHHARTRYKPPANSARSNLLASPPNISPPSQGTKRRNPESYDDDSPQLRDGLYFHRIDAQGRLVRRADADSLYLENPQATIPQRSHQRHPQRSDPPHARTNKRPRAGASQSHATRPIPLDDRVRTSMPSTSRHAAGYRQPSPYRSFRSPEHHMQVQSVSTIEEEDMQMREQVMYGDPDDDGSQYTGGRGEDDTGQDFYDEGDYLDDGYC